MKILLLTLMCLTSTVTSAKEVLEVESRLEQKAGYITVTVDSEELSLSRIDGAGIVVEDGIFVAKLSDPEQNIVIASAGVITDRYNSTALETVLVRVLKDKTSKKFHATKCTHVLGCVPYPHFEKERKLVLEIEAINGNIVCFQSSEGWSGGKCKK